jgi:hypothetical protein
MRAYKRAIQKLEDAETKYHAQAMAGDLDSAHVYARINERHCAMQGWSSVNVRLDPYAAQVKEEPSAHEQIRRAIFAVARGNPDYVPKGSGNGAVLAPPTAPSGADDDRENPGSRPQSDTTG